MTEPERIGTREVARMTGLSQRVVQQRAPQIPGSARLFGKWTFDRARLRRWKAVRTI